MVSVLLAAFNGEAYLPAQLDSIRHQTLTDWRVLWQDDGSADGTAALLQHQDACFVPGCEQGLHLGAIGNFLSLLRQDDAPYAALCDQDDLWHADRLSRCMAAMQEAERLYGPDTPLLVHSDCRVVDEAGQVLHASFFRHQGWDGNATSLPRLLVQNNVTGCTVLMNAPLRKLVTERARAEKLFMHDWFIALTAAAFGRIIFVDEALVDYRQHGANVVGASRTGLVQRGLAALRTPEKARARLALAYRHARMFRDTCASALPPEASAIVDAYLATERMPKVRRVLALRQGGYVMQSRVARMGQILLG
ncbi:MAG: glycosyltransferase family 2 protein [Clostridia bacterium]|nr:glycosyltransferase family 2 protein [Clostridia bacterium]